jgi:RHS repeat-associated protein
VTASFLYDGDGKRVQATVNGVTTQFVGSQVEWQSSTTDMLRYYYTGGVRVAMRTGDDGLVWLVGDHLGSTSIAVTDASGVTERQGYKAFGETRFGSLPTKYQFTGQHNETALGLYYYGARWYDSSLARFAQADTIVPDILDILSWDRYLYSRGNPINFVDPTGHVPDCADVENPACDPAVNSMTPRELMEQEAEEFGITFIGKWTLWAMRAVLAAVTAVGSAFAKVIGGSAASAFTQIYKYINFVWGTGYSKLSNECKNIGGGGCTSTGHLINFMSLSQPGGNRNIQMAYISARNNVVHELGHAFRSILYSSKTGDLYKIFGTSSVNNDDGFHPSPESANRTWRQNPDESSGERFADSFLGWVFDTWENSEAGELRDQYMTTNMAEWLSQYALDHPYYPDPAGST